MFVRLTRRMRAKAGWFVALLYLFCVLAPGIALAFGDAAPCLPAETSPIAVPHMHEDSVHTAHQHDAMGADHMMGQSAHHMADHLADAGHAKHPHDGKTSHGPCCAMLCLSAIPADLPTIAKPSQPISVRVAPELSAAAGQGAPTALSSSHRLI